MIDAIVGDDRSVPDLVLKEMARVADSPVISFENFGHWRRGATLALRGRMPETGVESNRWFDTPKIHPCSIRDFERLTGELGLNVSQRIFIDNDGRKSAGLTVVRPNLLARSAIYRVSR